MEDLLLLPEGSLNTVEYAWEQEEFKTNLQNDPKKKNLSCLNQDKLHFVERIFERNLRSLSLGGFDSVSGVPS